MENYAQAGQGQKGFKKDKNNEEIKDTCMKLTLSSYAKKVFEMTCGLVAFEVDLNANDDVSVHGDDYSRVFTPRLAETQTSFVQVGQLLMNAPLSQIHVDKAVGEFHQKCMPFPVRRGRELQQGWKRGSHLPQPKVDTNYPQGHGALELFLRSAAVLDASC